MDLEIFDRTKNHISSQWIQFIKDVLNYAGSYLQLPDNTEMSITLVNNDKIHKINKEYRNTDRATDVISFAIEDDSENSEEFPIKLSPEIANELPKNLGDIFVSVDKVKEQAEFLNHSKKRELGFLIVHGFLHLNGYDHIKDQDRKEMFDLQKKILNNYGLKRQ